MTSHGFSALRSALNNAFWTLRIALPKVAVGWMFALLTIDYNRVAIVELGITAVVVTTLLSIHYLLAPFQVFAGRLADTRPLFGLRRTPYLLLGSIGASLVFLALPQATFALAEGSVGGWLGSTGLFIVFGICMAFTGDNYHALIAENTTEKARPAVIATVWIVMILSTILSAVVMNAVRPEYSPEAMQTLYGLTPLIVISAVVLGTFGIERRRDRSELEQLRLTAQRLAPPGNPLRSAVTLLRGNRDALLFFTFIAAAIFGIFLQENLLEVFGAEVFGYEIASTTRFQPIWGVGVLLGMIATGIAAFWRGIDRRTLALTGCTLAATVYLAFALIALTHAEAALVPTLILLGFVTGIFNVGALALMMDMTVSGATGLYLGLWGTAQAMGMALSSLLSGALHSALIGSEFLTAASGYGVIFLIEAGSLAMAAALLASVSLRRFREQAIKPTAAAHDRNAEPASGIDALPLEPLAGT
ncbi:MAG: BCD family MFS transporter [Pseudomonadota bacterium]